MVQAYLRVVSSLGPYVRIRSVRAGRIPHAVAATVFSTVSLLCIYLVQYGLPHTPIPRSAPAAALVSPTTTPPAIAAPAKGGQPQLELHIANNGFVHLRGAQIKAIYRGSIDVVTKWGLVDLLWSIDTSSNTRYIAQGGEYAQREALRVGNFVSVSGILAGSGRSPVVEAQYVRLSR